jgi:virulence-associated protein VagC
VRGTRASQGASSSVTLPRAGDAVLDAALEIVIARQGKKPSTVIRPLSKKLRQALTSGWSAAG